MKKVIVLLVLIILVFSSILIVSEIKSSESNEITLKEAIEIGLNKAKNEWDIDAALFRATSIDDEKEGSKGRDGKRRHWNLLFAVPETKKLLVITIHDKEIVKFVSSEELLIKKMR